MVNWWVVSAVGAWLVISPSIAGHRRDRPAQPPPFEAWRAALVQEAVARGFGREFVEETLGDVQPLPQVLGLDRRQAETPPPLGAYLAERVTPELVASGREMIRRHGPLLDDVERRFGGVERRVVVAIWGAETVYGRYTGDVPVVRALATLAWEPRRSAYFRRELFHALTMLRGGHVPRHATTGSWAGAMGQPQFMPSSYLQYSVDFDGDGRRDIWDSVADTLGSIASYLQRFGWQRGIPWGAEVTMAPDVQAQLSREGSARTTGCSAARSLSEPRRVSEWAARGVHTRHRPELRRDVSMSLLTIDQRTFLVSANYETILRYNCSHRYALSVVILADQLG